MLSSYICYDKILNNKKNQIENNTEDEKMLVIIKL